MAASFSFLIYSRVSEGQLAALNQTSAEPVNLQVSAASAAVPDGPGRLVPFASGGLFPPVTRVQIPRLEIDSGTMELGTIIENGELIWETPKHAVGHHQGTANPGEIGNMVLSGHISSPLRNEGNVFQRLPEIRPGDDIIVTSDLATISYRVTETRVVEPHQIEVMAPTAEPIVTLITCVPDWVYTHRLIVIARPYRWEYTQEASPADS